VGSKKSILLYVYNNKYLITEFNEYIVESRTGFENKSLQGELFYYLELDENSAIKNAKTGIDYPLTVLQEKSFKVDTSNVQIQRDVATCPEMYPGSFTSCFRCAVNECSNDLLCTLSCGFQPAACVIGFTLACSLPIQ
jgi:hypothetical protein